MSHLRECMLLWARDELPRCPYIYARDSITRNDVSVVKFLIQVAGETLHYSALAITAAAHGNLALFNRLSRKVKFSRSDYVYLISAAAESRNVNLIKKITYITRDMNLSFISLRREAVIHEKFETLRWLHRNDSLVSSPQETLYNLERIAEFNKIRSLKFILSLRPDLFDFLDEVNVYDLLKTTLIRCRDEIFDEMISRGVRPASWDNYFISACKYRNIHVMDACVANGAIATAVSYSHIFAREYSASPSQKSSQKQIKRAFDYLRSIDAPFLPTGYDLLEIMRIFRTPYLFDMVRIYIEHGARVEGWGRLDKIVRLTCTRDYRTMHYCLAYGFTTEYMLRGACYTHNFHLLKFAHHLRAARGMKDVLCNEEDLAVSLYACIPSDPRLFSIEYANMLKFLRVNYPLIISKKVVQRMLSAYCTNRNLICSLFHRSITREAFTYIINLRGVDSRLCYMFAKIYILRWYRRQKIRRMISLATEAYYTHGRPGAKLAESNFYRIAGK